MARNHFGKMNRQQSNTLQIYLHLNKIIYWTFCSSKVLAHFFPHIINTVKCRTQLFTLEYVNQHLFLYAQTRNRQTWIIQITLQRFAFCVYTVPFLYVYLCMFDKSAYLQHILHRWLLDFFHVKVLWFSKKELFWDI